MFLLQRTDRCSYAKIKVLVPTAFHVENFVWKILLSIVLLRKTNQCEAIYRMTNRHFF